MDAEANIRKRWKEVEDRLDERGRRLWAAAEAKTLGRGGISIVARATKLSRTTVQKGVRDSRSRATLASGRARRPGGGRKQLVVTQQGLLTALDSLVDPSTRGDPMCALRWCSKSMPHLAEALRGKGFVISGKSVGRLLKQTGYTLQKTRKTLEGGDDPDRDAQFKKIASLVQEQLAAGQPVVSVDTKKKELIGNYANGGREWQPKGTPEEVKGHDFPDKDLGKGIPYGIYDQGRNEGFVSVGVTHDTPEFAVAALRRWWAEVGRPTYPKATSLLITADCGGSNGYRVRAWKMELQRFASDTHLRVRVAHFPPGTSKWNKIEHRMFCHITHNWRGRPLISREVIVSLIGSTKTSAGLRVRCSLDDRDYATGVKVTDEELASLSVVRDEFRGEWNYVLAPQRPS